MRDERHLSFKPQLENIQAACDFVVQAAEAAGLDERSTYHCQLAVDEACTNIIEHGFNTDEDKPNGQINLMTGIEDPNTFVIAISDNSRAFNPITYKEPDPAQPLSEREVGGWGIYFIKKLMDMVDYRYVDGKNNLTLHKYVGQSLASTSSYSDREVDISSEPLAKDYIHILLRGQVDSHTSITVETALDETIVAQGHHRLIIDFSEVSYISSSGLKVLVSAWRKAREKGGDVLLVGLQSRIYEVFEMIGFDMMFNIYDSVHDALEADPIGK